MNESELINKTVGVIVTYNPDIELLKKNIDAVITQVRHLYITDNNSNDTDGLTRLVNDYKNVTLITNEKNMGLPYCYNLIMKKAKANNFEWLLILDQDSVCPANMMKEYAKAAKKNVAIISPSILDINLNVETSERKTNSEFEIVEGCISSASLNNVMIAFEIGLFDERMFIDYVDYDFCKRVILNHYQIVKANNVILKHQVGESSFVRIFGRKVQIYNHSPIRSFYFFRNKYYYARKYNLHFYNEPIFYLNIYKRLILLFFEQESLTKLKLAYKGIREGKKMFIE